MGPKRSIRAARRGACVALAAGLGVVLSGCSGGSRSGAPAPPAPIVRVVEARQQTVPLLASPNGTTRALREVTVRARVRGFLVEQHFEEGADVKEGQLLFVIEEAPFQATLESAKAQLAEAEAALEKARVSKGREIATAQLALNQAELLLAQVEERREKNLVSRNASSREELDRREAVRKRAEAQVDADKASLEQARADYDVNIKAAEAKVAEAKAAVRQAELDLGYCRMFAPIDGRIGEAKVKVGNLVGPATGESYTDLASIQKLDPMGIDIQVSSRYLERANKLIQAGLTVRIERPNFEGEGLHPYPGKAFFLDNRIDPTTSTFLVKAEIPNPQKALLPGEYVQVKMVVGQVPDAVLVPEQAVMAAQGGDMVYVVDDQNKVTVARVEGPTTYEGFRVIRSGLEPGRKVIYEGLQLVRPGIVVQPEPADVPLPAAIAGATPAAPAPAEPEGPAGS